MNWNTSVDTNHSHTLNSSNGAFSFHASIQKAYDSDDSYQTVDEDDDEYAPISIAGWGDNAAKEEPASWDNLIDSSIKVKAGGIGSGNLHRRGANFKPLSEDTILAQRLNKPIPGKKLPGSKSRGGKKKKKSASATAKPPPFSRPAQFGRPVARVAPHVPPARQPSANAPPSPWGTIPLAETPFWEKKADPALVTATASAPAQNSIPIHRIAPTPVRTAPALARAPTVRAASPIPVLCETPFWEVKKEPVVPVAGVKTPATVTSVKVQAPTTPVPTPPKWNPQAHGFQPVVATTVSSPDASFNPELPLFNPGVPVSNLEVSAFNPGVLAFNPEVPAFNPEVPAYSPIPKVNNKLDFNPTLPSFNPTVPSFNPTVPSFNPTLSVSSSTSSANPTFNPSAQEFLPYVTLPVKKSIKITPPVESNRHTANAVVEGMRKLNMESQTGPESTRGLEEPRTLLQLNLELAPGISTEILVYEESNPRELAEDFARKHALNITNTAKANLAHTIRLLMGAKLNSHAQ